MYVCMYTYKYTIIHLLPETYKVQWKACAHICVYTYMYLHIHVCIHIHV